MGVVIDDIQKHILRVLVYFDIFQYPLNSKEVYKFLGTNSTNQSVVEQNLLQLTKLNLIQACDGFFGINNNRSSVSRRLKGNEQAAKFLPVAFNRAKFIAKFPFVRAVFASGSLSKNYMDEHSDLDFFVITVPGRLWIARTLLVLYKRVFLFNSFKTFCINYYVDENHLEIEEKNLFTATELATVIPLHNKVLYHRLMRKNPWLENIFPNFHPVESHESEPNISFVKKSLENTIGIFGNVPERLFMKLSLSRWKRLYRRDYHEKDFDIAFKTKAHASKNHPKNYQKKVMDTYTTKLKEFSEANNITL